MKLYELCSEMAALERAFDEADGDPILEQQILDRFSSVDVERDAKLGGIAALIKNAEAEAEMLANEAKRLTDMKRVRENRAKSLRQFVQFFLGNTPWKSSDGLHSFTYRKSVSCEPENEDAASEDHLRTLPAECYRVKVEPDKTAIKRILTEPGAVIPGWRLVEKSNLQVR